MDIFLELHIVCIADAAKEFVLKTRTARETLGASSMAMQEIFHVLLWKWSSMQHYQKS